MFKPVLRWLPGLVVGVSAVLSTLWRGLPAGADTNFHLYRLLEADTLLHHGLLLARWSPFLGFGYGLPMFHYYPPLCYLLAEGWLMGGWGTVAALRGLLAGALLLSALGIYGWIQDGFGHFAALVATVAYLFSPYFMYTLLHRAGFPEIVALAFMPWGLWALPRYHQRDQRRYALVAALCVAATLLTHLFTGYLYSGVMSVYALGLSLGTQPPASWLRRWGRLNAPLLLGMALAAFFWLPAMAEAHLIQLDRLLTLGNPATGEGLVTVTELLHTPVGPATSSATATIPPRVHPLTALLALIGVSVGSTALRARELKVQIWMATVLTVGALFMLTPYSRWLWQVLPLLRFAHFPIRWLGVASLWLAALAGVGAAVLVAAMAPHSTNAGAPSWSVVRFGQWGIVVLLCFGLVRYFPSRSAAARYLTDRGGTDRATAWASALTYERTTQMVGFLARGEYLPKTVQQMPGTDGPRPGDERLDRTSLPTGAQVNDAHYGPLAYAVTVNSPSPWRARFRTFAFPGWRATLNGQPASIVATQPFGLISVDVPAGAQHITIALARTPIQQGADLLTLSAVVMLLFYLISPKVKVILCIRTYLIRFVYGARSWRSCSWALSRCSWDASTWERG